MTITDAAERRRLAVSLSSYQTKWVGRLADLWRFRNPMMLRSVSHVRPDELEVERRFVLVSGLLAQSRPRGARARLDVLVIGHDRQLWHRAFGNGSWLEAS